MDRLLLIILLIQTVIISYLVYKTIRNSESYNSLETKITKVLDILTTTKINKSKKNRIRKIFSEDKIESIPITELTNIEAKEFFLQHESYANFALPPYIKFEKLLYTLDEEIEKNSNFLSSDTEKRPQKMDAVNYKLLSNKDGQYDWRPFEIVHPVLYVDIIRIITIEENWNEIVSALDNLQKKSLVECKSFPRKSYSNESDQAENISNWFEQIEQESISQSLKYRYIFKTDVTDCYGSIYVHSIPWALHTKKWCKQYHNNKDKKKKDKYKNSIGGRLERYLLSIQNNQTNGIPQGNVLSDLLAELVLAYADVELSQKLSTDIKSKIKIIRYRDDYRIFTNEKAVGEEVLNALTGVLVELGMKLSKGKTSVSEKIIEDSIKMNKLKWKVSYPVTKEFTPLTHLVVLLEFSRNYNNASVLKKELTNLYKSIVDWNYFKQDILTLISYTVEIAVHNPGVYPHCAALLSKFINSIEDNSERDEIFRLIKEKLGRIPNNEWLEIWLQRVIIKHNQDYKFDSKICQSVSKGIFDIWDSSWLRRNYMKTIKEIRVIDMEVIEEMDEVIQPVEFELFNNDKSL